MKVTLHLIAKHEEEYAQLHLHKENKRMEELKEYLENDGTSNPVLAVTQEGKAVYLSGKEILFVEADKNKRLVCTGEGSFHSQYKLYELEHMLPASFARVSKSVILNTDQVKVYRPLANGLMAAELGCGEEFCAEIVRAGMVHDIGKLQLGKYLYGRDDALLKIEELKYIRLHPVLGYRKLQKLGDFSETILRAVYHHHENFDGSGYPDGMKGEEIPLTARIVRIADTFDSMLRNRCYRPAYKRGDALSVMESGRGKKYDPYLLDVFFKIEKQMKG